MSYTALVDVQLGLRRPLDASPSNEVTGAAAATAGGPKQGSLEARESW